MRSLSKGLKFYSESVKEVDALLDLTVSSFLHKTVRVPRTIKKFLIIFDDFRDIVRKSYDANPKYYHSTKLQLDIISNEEFIDEFVNFDGLDIAFSDRIEVYPTIEAFAQKEALAAMSMCIENLIEFGKDTPMVFSFENIFKRMFGFSCEYERPTKLTPFYENMAIEIISYLDLVSRRRATEDALRFIACSPNKKRAMVVLLTFTAYLYYRDSCGPLKHNPNVVIMNPKRREFIKIFITTFSEETDVENMTIVIDSDKPSSVTTKLDAESDTPSWLEKQFNKFFKIFAK